MRLPWAFLGIYAFGVGISVLISAGMLAGSIYIIVKILQAMGVI